MKKEPLLFFITLMVLATIVVVLYQYKTNPFTQIKQQTTIQAGNR